MPPSKRLNFFARWEYRWNRFKRFEASKRTGSRAPVCRFVHVNEDRVSVHLWASDPLFQGPVSQFSIKPNVFSYNNKLYNHNYVCSRCSSECRLYIDSCITCWQTETIFTSNILIKTPKPEKKSCLGTSCQPYENYTLSLPWPTYSISSPT